MQIDKCEAQRLAKNLVEIMCSQGYAIQSGIHLAEMQAKFEEVLHSEPTPPSNGNGRYGIVGSLGSCDSIRVYDNYSSSGPAVEVAPFWNNDAEEMQVRLSCYDSKDSTSPTVEVVWDGICLMQGRTVVAR